MNKRDSKFNTVKNHELIKNCKRNIRISFKISMPVPLTHLVNFYYRYWNNEISDDESGDTS
jgi:hypothetical protein